MSAKSISWGKMNYDFSNILIILSKTFFKHTQKTIYMCLQYNLSFVYFKDFRIYFQTDVKILWKKFRFRTMIQYLLTYVKNIMDLFYKSIFHERIIRIFSISQNKRRNLYVLFFLTWVWAETSGHKNILFSF